MPWGTSTTPSTRRISSRRGSASSAGSTRSFSPGVEIDFRAEIRPGEEVEVHSRCARIGTKSFDLDHQIWADDRLVAEAKSVLVGYDYTVGASVPLTEDLRRKLTA